jgi:hypothetical protein
MRIEDELDPEERAEWAKFVAYQREHTIGQMAKSAYVMSLVTTAEIDIEFAVQTGMAVLMDKPIMVVVFPGATLSEKFLKVADEVVYADMDTEAGREKVRAGIDRMHKRLEAKGDTKE